MEILEFIFQSFWHWLGALVLISVPFSMIANAISGASRGRVYIKTLNRIRKNKPDTEA